MVIMNNTKNRPPFYLKAASLVALLVFCAIFFTEAGSGFQVSASSNAPMVWSVTSHNGKELHSSALIGKVTIVTFWATWCIPCIVEIPALHDLVNKYEKNGLAVVGVSVDAQSPAMLQAFVDKFKMNYTVALMNPGMMNNFGVGDNVPMTFVINQQGIVVRKHMGYVKKEELEKDIRPLLKL